jgi:BTB/POZ domain-containing protein KCTD9
LFIDANLVGANLRTNFLTSVNFSGAYLLWTDLSGVDLTNVNLSNVYLVGANLSNTNLSDTNLSGADLENSNLEWVENLTPEQVKTAKNWEKAKYDDEFKKKLGLK